MVAGSGSPRALSLGRTGRDRTRGLIGFGLVGLSGIFVNQLVLLGLTEVFGLFYLISAIAATQSSTAWNYLATDRFVFQGRRDLRPGVHRFLAFLAINNLTLLIRIPLLWVFTELVGIHYLWGNLASLLALFAVRYFVADGWIWSSQAVANEGLPIPGQLTAVPSEEAAASASRFCYDVAGILSIHSDVELRELAYFRSEITLPPDLQIRVGRVGTRPRMRTRFVNDGSALSYLEHLGIASANFRVTMGQPVVVQVAPLLAKSPHVLYTNVIEALLRFLLVSRGYVLLHSACIMDNGRAVLLSAQTDTGKTSTVIRLVRDHGFTFLSDDMTILSPDGTAICYPKPMTLSFHTMSSIPGRDLTFRQRAALSVQSRVHSKSGRTAGKSLGQLNIPIMSVNAVVQMLIPPPKHRIDKLMSVAIEPAAPIGHVFIMERGEELEERLTVDQAIPTLIENTDDAYGFPPFATFAPHLQIAGDGYLELRRKEEELLRRSLARAVLYRVRVPGHAWAERLPELMAQDTEDARQRLTSIPISSGPALEAESLVREAN